MATHASGTFDVKVAPQTATEFETSVGLARYSIDKEIHGELEATSKGEMLATNTEVKGSAAYVALEKVTGMLNGRAGTFILQHSASMTSNSQQMLITVVPDSGTGQLIRPHRQIHHQDRRQEALLRIRLHPPSRKLIATRGQEWTAAA